MLYRAEENGRQFRIASHSCPKIEYVYGKRKRKGLLWEPLDDWSAESNEGLFESQQALMWERVLELKPLAYHVARKYKLEDEIAESVGLDTLCRAAVLYDPNRKAALGTFAYRSLCNAYYAYQQWVRSHVSLDDIGELVDPSDVYSELDDRATVEALVGLMPTELRDIYELRFVRGLNYSQIAEQLGLSSKTSALVRIRRLLSWCQDKLDEPSTTQLESL